MNLPPLSCLHNCSDSGLHVYTIVLIQVFMFTQLFCFRSSCLHNCSATGLHVYTIVLLQVFMFTQLFCFRSSCLHNCSDSGLHVYTIVLLQVFMFTQLFCYRSSCLHNCYASGLHVYTIDLLQVFRGMAPRRRYTLQGLLSMTVDVAARTQQAPMSHTGMMCLWVNSQTVMRTLMDTRSPFLAEKGIE